MNFHRGHDEFRSSFIDRLVARTPVESLEYGSTSASSTRIRLAAAIDACNLIDEASGWASHTWQKAREKLDDAKDAIGAQAVSGTDKAAEAGAAIKGQIDNLNQTILRQFRDQPLVGGAMAFALGAALGSALPHTHQEDELMGEASDAVKDKAGGAAADVYEDGKEKAAELYTAVSEKAGDVYQQTKDGVSQSLGASA